MLDSNAGSVQVYAFNGEGLDYGNKSDAAYNLSATLIMDVLQEGSSTIINKFFDMVISKIHLNEWTITDKMIREFVDYCRKLAGVSLCNGEDYSFPRQPIWTLNLDESLAIR